ncbi:uncharacterized protein [Aristolochia californica]|uniref:uncharacterized protein isoform X2 n=1 Tax=Aristolochia californica TaxID=171875 RepID=UPI0035DD13EC
MDRYQRVEKPRPETAIKENEIRITTQGLIRNYISYATSLLQEKRVREIVLKAMGQAISKTVAIAEIIKKKIPGLHQDTTISSTSITDVWEPIEEGLVPLEMTRHVSMISISLSTKELNKNSPGISNRRNTNNSSINQSWHQVLFLVQMKIHMGGDVVEVEEEEGLGAEEDTTTTKKMVDGTMTTGTEVVDVAEAGGIKVGMKEAEVVVVVVVVEAMDEVGEGWEEVVGEELVGKRRQKKRWFILMLMVLFLVGEN